MLFNIVLEVLEQSGKKKNYRHPNWKERIQLFADDIHRTLYRLRLKTVRNNELSKVTGYKINMQKSVTFLYTNKLSETLRKLIYNCTKESK